MSALQQPDIPIPQDAGAAIELASTAEASEHRNVIAAIFQALYGAVEEFEAAIQGRSETIARLRRERDEAREAAAAYERALAAAKIPLPLVETPAVITALTTSIELPPVGRGPSAEVVPITAARRARRRVP